VITQWKKCTGETASEQSIKKWNRRQTMSDLISRKDLIPVEWVKNRIKEIKHAHEVYGVKNNEAITILESMLDDWEEEQREFGTPFANQWFSVGEKLPRRGQKVLVCTKEIIAIDSLEQRGWRVYRDDVIAWMPLPEPYQGDKE
jgi:hypothetical protein